MMQLFLHLSIVPLLATLRFGLGIAGFVLALQALRITIQARRSRPDRKHPTDAMALFSPAANVHITTRQARRKRSRLLLAMAACLVIAPSFGIIEELLDEPTTLWPRYTATITAVERLGIGENVRLTYIYDNPMQGLPLFGALEPERIEASAQVNAAAGPYTVGDPLRIYIHPYDPDDSALDPPLISRDGTPVYAITLMTPFVIGVGAISAAVLNWVRRRQQIPDEQPLAEPAAVREHLAPLSEHIGAQMHWRPRWYPESAIHGIRHVLLYQETMLGLLEYDPSTPQLVAVFAAGSYQVDCSSVRHTVATHAYASADLVPMGPLVVHSAGQAVATLRFHGLDFTKLFLHEGPSYTLYSHRAYRPREREHALMLYGRKDLPSGLGKLFTYDFPWRPSHIRFEEVLPAEHLAPLALAGWFTTRWYLPTQQVERGKVFGDRGQ